MNNIVQIIPADYWFYIARTPKPMEPALCIYRVTVWALHHDNTVTGLIGIPCFASMNGTKSPPLCELPSLDGMYKHMDDFTEQEWAAYNNRGYLRLSKPTFDDVH